jgi:hypothetical protein
MLFGTPVYKKRLGAEPENAYKVSLFRSSPFKPLYAKERAVMLARDRQRIYSAARHEAKRRLQSALRIVRPLADGERDGSSTGPDTNR